MPKSENFEKVSLSVSVALGF